MGHESDTTTGILEHNGDEMVADAGDEMGCECNATIGVLGHSGGETGANAGDEIAGAVKMGAGDEGATDERLKDSTGAKIKLLEMVEAQERWVGMCAVLGDV